MNKKPVQKGGFYQPDTLKADFAYWEKMPEWSASEAAALLLGLNPFFAGSRWMLSSSQEAEYEGLLELARRALNCGRVGRPPTPARWLAWAQERGLHIPPELEVEVAKYDQQPVLPGRPVKATDAEIDSWIRERDAAEGRRVGKLALWKLAQEIGLCKKVKLEERTRLASRGYPLKVGRRKKKSAEKTGPKI